MKKLLLSFVAVFAVLLLTACGSKNKLLGTWEGATQDGLKTTFIFEKNDVVKYKNEYGFDSEGTYKIKDNKVTITLKSWSNSKVYEFEVRDKRLTLLATDQYSPSYRSMTKKK